MRTALRFTCMEHKTAFGISWHLKESSAQSCASSCGAREGVCVPAPVRGLCVNHVNGIQYWHQSWAARINAFTIDTCAILVEWSYFARHNHIKVTRMTSLLELRGRVAIPDITDIWRAIYNAMKKTISRPFYWLVFAI